MQDPATIPKLIILYMLGKVEFPLSYAQIADFMLLGEHTTYFELQSILTDLTEAQMVRQETGYNTSCYSLDAIGEDALHYFYTRIPESVRKDIDRYIRENKIQFRDDISVVADYYKNTANEYSVRCVVKEKYSNPIDLTVTVPEESQAQAICRNWKEHCQKVYEFIMKELL